MDQQESPSLNTSTTDREAPTQPSRAIKRLESYETSTSKKMNSKKKSKTARGCCSCSVLIIILLIFAVGLYVIFPERITVLLMGIDTRDIDSNLGRTDTLILSKLQPAIVYPEVALLSIPRDLWVDIPGIGENRINTAHFFAESEQTGSGPQAAIEAVKTNFGVDVRYYVRIRFDGLMSVVDILGGVDLNFSRPMSGYSAGSHHLNGEQVLAFVRDRQSSDDFFRMERGQLFLKAFFGKFMTPSTWLRIPQSIPAIRNAVDTNIPFWQWPRILLTLLRVGPDGTRSFVISREMVEPFTTRGGAQVLSPKWELIKPMVSEMIGE